MLFAMIIDGKGSGISTFSGDVTEEQLDAFCDRTAKGKSNPSIFPHPIVVMAETDGDITTEPDRFTPRYLYTSNGKFACLEVIETEWL